MPENAHASLLLVDDDEGERFAVRRYFERQGYRVHEGGTVAEARRLLAVETVDAAILDLSLPDGDGLDVLADLAAAQPEAPALILTAHATIERAVTAIQQGADQFLTKPIELKTLVRVVDGLVRKQRDARLRLAGSSRASREAVDPFAGEGPALVELAERARRVAGSSSPVLIEGETGTGKSALAAWLHRSGPRRDQALVDLNGAGLSEELLESELFGYAKGAFTGATAEKRGLLEVAHRGTLFLDEIGDMTLPIQAKLLKVLEEQRFRRLGELTDRRVDVRLIAATHHDLQRLVAAGSFRADLLYRVSALTLRLPPLRERGDDVVRLSRDLLARVSTEMGRPGLRLTPEAERAIAAQPWPGNVRQLRNVLERAALFADRDVLGAADLGIESQAPRGAGRTLAEAVKRHVATVLHEEGGDVQRASRALGISRAALYRHLRKHGIASSPRRS